MCRVCGDLVLEFLGTRMFVGLGAGERASWEIRNRKCSRIPPARNAGTVGFGFLRRSSHPAGRGRPALHQHRKRGRMTDPKTAPTMSKSKDKTTMTGAGILWECLEREGVKVVFGYPGGAILPAYDALKHSKIHHILVRHEQGATHMADGYARASGEVGVAVGTSGPGATNMVTGIATAMLDSSPIVCITGQVGSKLIGSDAFQETDITGVTLPITKHNYLVTHASEVARTVREAFYVARSGRPCPVLVDITKDAQQTTCEFDWEASVPHLPPKRQRINYDQTEFELA